MLPARRSLACLAAVLILGGCDVFKLSPYDPDLVSIDVTLPGSSIPAGVTKQLAATATFSDGKTHDVTSSVRWTSFDPDVAVVSETGAVTAIAAGSARIAATDPTTSVTGRTTLTVNSAQVVSIAVTPSATSVPQGFSVQFTATGTFTDGATEDITNGVVWSSSSAAVAAFSSPSEVGLALTGITGTVTITARHPSAAISGSTTLAVTSAQLVSMAIAPAAASIVVGVTRPFTATGTYTNGSTQDLTSQVAWSSSDESVATISNTAGSRGVATGAAAGTTTIEATDPVTLISASATLSVTDAHLVSIDVTPSAPSIPAGLAQQFVATGTYTDGSTHDLTAVVTWWSSDDDVAAISNATGSSGLASSGATGTTTIRALDPATQISGSTTLTVTPAQLVSIAVTPADTSVRVGARTQFTATGTYTDGTTQNLTAVVTWSSSDPSVASLSNAKNSKGLASSTSAGTTTIQATDPATRLVGSTTLTVTSAQGS